MNELKDLLQQLQPSITGEKLNHAHQYLDLCQRIESGSSYFGGETPTEGRTLTQLELEAKDAALRMLTRLFDAECPREVD